MGVLSDVLGTGLAVGDLGLSIWGAKRASDEASANRDFQERMSGSAHQREVDDLRKAGLNPILSAGGGGSSTPSGAVGAVPQMDNLGKSVASASQAAATRASINLMNEQAKTQQKTQDNLQQDIYTKNSQELLNDALAQEALARKNRIGHEIPGIDMQTADIESLISLRSFQGSSAAAQASLAESQKALNSAQAKAAEKLAELHEANATAAEIANAGWEMLGSAITAVIDKVWPDADPTTSAGVAKLMIERFIDNLKLRRAKKESPKAGDAAPRDPTKQSRDAAGMPR